MRRLAAGAGALLAAGLAAALVVTPTWASFSRTAADAGNSFAAAADFRPPTASATTVVKTQGGTPGFVKRNGTYTVLAQVADSGNPASGILSVTGDLTALTAGQGAVALANGSFSAGGASYNRGSGTLTAGGSITEGVTTYSLTSTDNASNAGTQTGFTVTVDNTAPTAADIQTANASGGTGGRPQTGDTITLTFSEPMERGSIVSGWSSGATTVVVRIADGGGLLGLGNDAMTIRNAANSAQLPLGDVDLGRGDYRVTLLGLGGPINFTGSSMTMSGNALTITLGTPDDSANTAGGDGTMTWGPDSGPYDRAANGMSTASRTETGSADREF